ncbi:serine hydrolase domain-containing protein [Pollutibacter soli]|uniref:serine hydrolase domain-containing protein n=1 Tax=Pollutibacter soli TaxID=3034157 RepID=UPI0030132EDC
MSRIAAFIIVSCTFFSSPGKGQAITPAKDKIKSIDGKGYRSKTEIDKFLHSQMDSIGIVGLSIVLIEDSKVVYTQTLGMQDKEKNVKADEQTLFEAASMTKPVFAYAVLKLAGKGVLNLDTPLYKYYPYKDISHDKRYELITARMVLNHSSGLPNWRHEKFRELTIDADPGTKFEYSGEAYGYLGLVVEQITGKNLQEVLKEEVFIPLGMQHSFMIWNDELEKHKAMGYEKNEPTQVFKPLRAHPAGTLHTNAQDYAKFLIALMNEDKGDKSIFRQMSAPQIEGKAPTPGDPNSGIWVGSGIFIEKTPYGIKYHHGGNNGDFMGNFLFFKDQRTAYVFFMNCDKMPQFMPKLDRFLTAAEDAQSKSK